MRLSVTIKGGKFKLPDGRKLVAETAASIASALEQLTLERFDTRTDPERNAWDKRTRAYDHPILDDEGDLKKSLEVTGSARQVRAAAHDFKASYHQFGTPRMVARPFFPVDGHLPVGYEDEFDTAALIAMSKALK